MRVDSSFIEGPVLDLKSRPHAIMPGCILGGAFLIWGVIGCTLLVSEEQCYRKRSRFNMAVRHLYTHVSEYFVRDVDGRISFINIINNVTLDGIPGALTNLCIGVGFTGGEGQTFSVCLEDPKKKKIFRSDETPVPSPSSVPSNERMRSVTNAVFVIGPAVFPVEGTYHVVFRVGNKVIHREPIPVVSVATTEESEENADQS